MEAEGGRKRQVPRRKKKRTEETSAYPEPDNGSDPLPPKALLRGRTRVEGNRRNRNKSAESLPESVIRRHTRPALPCCRRIRQAISDPPRMMTATSEKPNKRRLEMTPSVLAKKVAHRHGQSRREVAEELASRHDCPPKNDQPTKTLFGPCGLLNVRCVREFGVICRSFAGPKTSFRSSE